MKKVIVISIFMTAALLAGYYIRGESNTQTLIVCSEKLGDSWVFKVPNFEGDCPDYATHWEIVGKRIKN